MLSFAGCDDDHTAPCIDQRRKYAEVKYDEYAEDGVYIAKGVYVAKGENSEYTEDGVSVAKGEYSEYAKEDASVEEGHNEPLAKEGDDEPLAKNGDWAGCDDEPLATKSLGTAYKSKDLRRSNFCPTSLQDPTLDSNQLL
jgi:hypothetical protein